MQQVLAHADMEPIRKVRNILKNNGFVKAWNILYPIFIYYVVSNVVIYLAALLLGVSRENYVVRYTMLQTIATAVALPILYRFYRADQMLFTVFQQRTAGEFRELTRNRKLINALLCFLCGALAGIVLNNIIGATGLAQLSAGYQEVTEHFWSGSVVFEILGPGLLIPLVEELLYRGIVYGRLSDWLGIPVAAVVSALIFGGLHFNIVQFIYAFFIGLLLVFFLEKSHNLIGAVLGHMGANLLAVLRMESNALDWMESSAAVYWGSTAVMALVCAGLVFLLAGKKRGGEKL